jgi:hypothetical protein
MTTHPLARVVPASARRRLLVDIGKRLAGRAVALVSAAFLASAIVAPAVASDASPDAGLSTADWASVRAAYDASRHQVRAAEGGFVARNPGQAWHTRFDGTSFLVTPDSRAWTWGLRLVRFGRGDETHDVLAPTGLAVDGGRLAYDWSPALTEWYVNDRRGLEHGYTVHERPPSSCMAPADERLAFTLAVRGDLRPSVTDQGRSVQFVDASGTSLVTYSGLIAFDADGVRLPAAFDVGASMVGGFDDSIVLRVDDRHARYPITIDPIAQQGYFKASNTGIDDIFGASVAIDGDTLVVGASGESSNATGVNGNQADNSAEDAGAVYVFVRSGTAWVQQAYLKASNTNANDIFGRSVAISGDTIVVGADAEDSNATGVNGNQSDNSLTNPGAAYVFVRTGTTWSQQAYLKASNTGQFDFFGFSVAISGETIVVGAMGEDSGADGINGNQADNSALTAGAAYVFVRSGTTWSQQAYLKASNSEGGDNFGDSVSISGNTIVVGANLEDSAATGINGNQASNAAGGSGAAYVFVRSGTTWSQQAYVKASNTGAADQFGASVAISGDTMVVGAFSENSGATGVNGNQADSSASSAGAAYVFVRSGTSWSQQAYLKASNTDAGDSFGADVAISGDIVVAGATWESSAAAGVNGDQSDESLSSAGAAYVFGRTGTTWSQLAYLKASNPDAQDGFGGALAVSGGTVVVGAAGEDSSATGVNGVQGSDATSGSGAAYLFYIPPSLDCNGNGIPDDAELAGNDCNNNGVPDDCEPGVTCCDGDLNGDGKVDGADLALVLSAWGVCP